MSRSRRKNAVFANLCNGDSQKEWKQRINRIFRRKSKVHLDTSIDENGVPLKDYFHRDIKKQTYADEWLSPADGTQTIKMLTLSEFNEEMNKNNIQNVHFPRRLDSLQIKTYDDYVDYYKRKIISK